MTSLKKKLMAAISMLTVSGMMLTTASFAWFTISTNPEITGLTTTVVVNENLELAVAKESAAGDTILATDAQLDYTDTSLVTNYYTYGNLVDFSGTTDGSLGANYTAFLTGADKTANTDDDITLAPMAVNSGSTGFVYPIYGYSGRVDSLTGVLTPDESDGSFGTLIDGSGNIYGYYIDFWMRSNVGGAVELTAATDRADGSTGSETASAATGAGTTFTTDNEELAKGIGIAFATIDTSGTVSISDTDTIGLATTSSTAGSTGVVVATVEGTVKDDDDIWTTTFDDEVTVAYLAANVDTLVRMYVYLDGTNVSNASASLVGDLTTGTLNVQFGIDDVDDAMNTPLVSTSTLTTDPGDSTT